MNSSEIVKKLQAGNERFVAGKPPSGQYNRERRTKLHAQQTPYATILSCADSRVVPEWIFDAGLGDLFVVRAAGNVAVNAAIASIEYSILHCGVQTIVVLGHENCGAVSAALQGGEHSQHIDELLATVQPAIADVKTSQKSESNLLKEVIKRHAVLNAQKLWKHSPIIKEAKISNEIEIVPAYYELVSGQVEFIETE